MVTSGLLRACGKQRCPAATSPQIQVHTNTPAHICMHRKFLCCFKIRPRPPQRCFVSSSPSHPAENILPSTRGRIKAGLSRGHLSPRGVPTGQFHVSLFELKAGFLQGAHSTGRQETKPPLRCPSAPHRGPAPAPQPTVKHHGGISQKGREAQKNSTWRTKCSQGWPAARQGSVVRNLHPAGKPLAAVREADGQQRTALPGPEPPFLLII